MAIYITKDNFAWLDVTERMKYGNKKREEVWMAHELYVVHDDDSDSQIESHDEIDEALKLGLQLESKSVTYPSHRFKIGRR